MKTFLLPLTLISLLGACGGGGGDGPPHADLALIVTDAPFPYEIVHSVTIQIDRIAIDAGLLDPIAPPRVIYAGGPKQVELTGLRNGNVLHLLDAHLPIGTYSRIFLHLAGVRLELVNGHVLDSQDGSLAMPVMDELGLAFDLLTPVSFAGGGAERLLFDFDLTRCFVPVGNADPLLAPSFQFDPILHVVRPGVAGEIRGVVTQDDGAGHQVPVANATVYVLAAGSETVDYAFASTSTDSDGSFVQLGVPPGTYDLRAFKAGVDRLITGNVVVANNYTVVDLTLP